MDRKQKSRSRAANYIPSEKEMLVRLVAKYLYLIENKRMDLVSLEEKADGWNRLATEFAAKTKTDYRNATSLKKCWENLKKAARNQAAQKKEKIFGSGGRLQVPQKREPLLEHVGFLIGPALHGLHNPFDSDCDISAHTNTLGVEEFDMEAEEENEGHEVVPETQQSQASVTTWSLCNPNKSRQSVSPPLRMQSPIVISGLLESCASDPIPQRSLPSSHKLTPVTNKPGPLTSHVKGTPVYSPQEEREKPAWMKRRRPVLPVENNKSQNLVETHLEHVAVNKKLVIEEEEEEMKKELHCFRLQEHEWKIELYKLQIEEQKLKNRLLSLQVEELAREKK